MSSKLTWTIIREAYEQLGGLVPLQAWYITAWTKGRPRGRLG